MIIKYQKKYLNKLAVLDYESGLPYHKISKPTKKDLKKWLASKFKKKNEIFYLYKKEKEIIGAVGYKEEFLGVKKACEITYLAVNKSHHRQKIGTKLLEFVESKLIKKGFKRIYLITGKNNNDKAIKFYKKHDYKRYAVLKNHHRMGDDSLLFRKDYS